MPLHCFTFNVLRRRSNESTAKHVFFVHFHCARTAGEVGVAPEPFMRISNSSDFWQGLSEAEWTTIHRGWQLRPPSPIFGQCEHGSSSDNVDRKAAMADATTTCAKKAQLDLSIWIWNFYGTTIKSRNLFFLKNTKQDRHHRWVRAHRIVSILVSCWYQ